MAQVVLAQEVQALEVGAPVHMEDQVPGKALHGIKVSVAIGKENDQVTGEASGVNGSAGAWYRAILLRVRACFLQLLYFQRYLCTNEFSLYRCLF